MRQADRVVSGLPAWVGVGLVNGVGTFTLCNLIEHKDLPEVLARENAPIVRHVASMERDPLIAACASIMSAVGRAQEAGAAFIIQPGILEGINERLRQLGVKQALTFSPLSPTTGVVNGLGNRLIMGETAEAFPAPANAPGGVAHDIDGGQSQTMNSRPQAGQTRDCLEPWSQPFLLANGDLWPCPWFYSRLGNVHDEPFDKLMNGAAFRQLREELLTGKLRPACSECPSRGITTPALLLQRLSRTQSADNPEPPPKRQSGILNRAVSALARVAHR